MASGSSSLDQLSQLYKHVIDDVVRNMREEYLNEGMDTELLEELKQIWLSKLNSSGAVNRPAKPEIPARKDTPTKSSQKQSGLVQNSTLASSSAPSLTAPQLISPPQAISSSSSSSAVQHGQSSVPKTLPTPTIPVSPSVTPGNAVSTTGHTSRVTAATVSPGSGVTPAVNPFMPSLSMVNPTVGQMGQFAQGMFPIQTPNGTVLVNLQTFMTLNKLQQQQQQQQQPQQQQPQQQQQQRGGSAPQPKPGTPEKGKDVVQIDGLLPAVGVVGAPLEPCKSKQGGKKAINQVPIIQLGSNSSNEPMAESHSGSDSSGFHIPQLDGYGTGGKGAAAADESSSEDDSDVDDSSADDPGSAHSDDGSPLNSADDIESDVDDPEANDDFETQDVIVCQWEKVYRVKNKWKFLLKDGVMHLNSYDYIFHKVSGEADW